MAEQKLTTEENSLWRFFWPAMVFLVNFFYKLRYITHRDISLDEPWSIFHAQMTPQEIIQIQSTGNNPPLFELLLHYWMLIFDNGPVAMRFLPLIFSSLVAAVLFRFGHKFFSWYAGLIAALLFTFNTLHFFFALEARVYSLLALLTAVSVYSFISLYRRPGSRKYLIMLTISNVLIGYAHYFGLFIVFAEGILLILFIFADEKKFAKQLLISMGVFGVLYLPIIFILYERYTSTIEAGTWVPPPSGLREFFLQPIAFFNGLYPLQQAGKVVLIALAAVIIYWWLRQSIPYIKNHKIRIANPVFLLWAIPYSIMFFGSYEAPMFIIRYILFTSVSLYLFAGALLHLLFGRNLIIYTIVVIFCAYYFSRSLEINPDYFYQREVKSAVEKVKELEQAYQNAPVFIHPAFTYLGFLYYYDRDLFSQPYKADSLLKENQIYNILSFSQINPIIEEQKFPAFIIYQDGSRVSEIIEYISSQYDSLYIADTTNFYPQTFYTTRFVKRK